MESRYCVPIECRLRAIWAPGSVSLHFAQMQACFFTSMPRSSLLVVFPRLSSFADVHDLVSLPLQFFFSLYLGSSIESAG